MSDKIKLSEIAEVLGLKITDILKACFRIECFDVEDEEDKVRIESEARDLGLRDNGLLKKVDEILQIPEIKRKTQEYFSVWRWLGERQHEGYKRFVATKIYEMLPEDKKAELTIDDLYKTILNVGRVKLRRGSPTDAEDNSEGPDNTDGQDKQLPTFPPEEVYNFDKRVYVRGIEQYIITVVQKKKVKSISDIEIVENEIRELFEKIRSGDKDVPEHIKRYVGKLNG
jgi:hypothetical protein